jgi:hypothetical protein
VFSPGRVRVKRMRLYTGPGFYIYITLASCLGQWDRKGARGEREGEEDGFWSVIYSVPPRISV